MKILLGVALLALLLPVAVVVLTLGSTPPAQGGAGGLGSGLRPGSVPAAYAAFVEQAGSLCVSAPPSIIAAQIEQESGFNPRAVSPAGAEGIAQFMPETWPAWSQPGQSPFDPTAAIPAQGRYDCALAATMIAAQSDGRLPKSASVTELMLAAYNAGSGAVLGAGGIPQNGQTPDYVAAIIRDAAQYANATGAGLAAGSLAGKEIAVAAQEEGLPYVWGGGSYTGPTGGGFDCSGLMMFVLYQASGGRVRLPHSSDLQTRSGTPVPRDQLQPGDLISFTLPGSATAHHVGLYIGNGQMIDAPDFGETVRVENLAGAYYQQQQWRVARY